MFVWKKIKVNTHIAKDEFIAISDTTTFEPEVITSAYLISLVQDGLSIKTVESHASAITHFLNAVYSSSTAHVDWWELQEHHLQAYQEARAYELKEGTYLGVVSILKSLFSWSYENGWIDERLGYNWKLPHALQREIKTYKNKAKSKDPFNLFAKYIPEHEFEYLLQFNPRINSFARIRDEIVLKLGYYSGFRRAETVDPININLKKIRHAIAKADEEGVKGFELNIIGKGRGGGKVRTVYIPPPLRRQIEQFIRNELKRKAPNSTLLLCKLRGKEASPLNSQHATQLFDEAKQNLLAQGELDQIKTWVKNEKKRTFHALRHSYATNFADNVNRGQAEFDLLQERMGHRYRETTKLYLWFSAKRLGDELKAQKYADELEACQSLIKEECEDG